jgi:cellulose synthase (UDP-forming)
MSRLASWLLIPPVSSRLSEHYRHFRRHGASAFSAARLLLDDSGLDVHSP